MANEEQLAILRQGVEAWNAWREEHPDVKLDLQLVVLSEKYLGGANLEGVLLTGSDLYGADLPGANLRGANLTEVNLRGANLREADLCQVDFTRAVLAGANFEEALLRGSRFYGTDLARANLQKADVTNATVAFTIFGDLDLRQVYGLDTMRHLAPSTIGIDTIYRSEGDISEVFLRGCGVPNSMIDYARAPVLAERPIDYYSCFISYSHADKSFARRLYDALQGRGIRCWLDEHQVLPGHDIYDEVDRGIRLWDKVLFCASKDSLMSWWVDNELNKAFTKEQQLMKQQGSKVRALIPLNLDNALWQWQNGKADEVRSRLAANFTGWKRNNAKFEREFERLVKVLRTDEGREEPPKSRL